MKLKIYFTNLKKQGILNYNEYGNVAQFYETDFKVYFVRRL